MHRDVKLRINVLDMSTSSPYWHTIFCNRIYEGDSRCAKYRSWGIPVSSCPLVVQVKAGRHCLLCVWAQLPIVKVFVQVSDIKIQCTD